MTDTTTLEATIDTYLEAYLEPDAERRARSIEQVWAPDGHLFDPPLDAARAQLVAATSCSPTMPRSGWSPPSLPS